MPSTTRIREDEPVILMLFPRGGFDPKIPQLLNRWLVRQAVDHLQRQNQAPGTLLAADQYYAHFPAASRVIRTAACVGHSSLSGLFVVVMMDRWLNRHAAVLYR